MRFSRATFSTVLLLYLKPNIINYKMILSKKTNRFFVNVTLTRLGRFLAMTFEAENLLGEKR